MKRSENERGAPQGGERIPDDDDFEEFERQTGYAGERAYPPGWRPAKPGDRTRGSSGTRRPARPDFTDGNGGDGSKR